MRTRTNALLALRIYDCGMKMKMKFDAVEKAGKLYESDRGYPCSMSLIYVFPSFLFGQTSSFPQTAGTVQKWQNEGGPSKWGFAK